MTFTKIPSSITKIKQKPTKKSVNPKKQRRQKNRENLINAQTK